MSTDDIENKIPLLVDGEEHDLMITCYSNLNKDASFSFGVTITDNSQINAEYLNWFWEGFGDSFWENFYVFEDGLSAIKELMAKDNALKFRDAFDKVFGKFKLSYKLEDNPIDISLNVNLNDINNLLYELISDCPDR